MISCFLGMGFALCFESLQFWTCRSWALALNYLQQWGQGMRLFYLSPGPPPLLIDLCFNLCGVNPLLDTFDPTSYSVVVVGLSLAPAFLPIALFM